MRRVLTSRTMRAAGRMAGVVLMLVLLLGLGAVASSPALHLKICPQANQPGHHCAVTAFAGGALAGSVMPVVVATVWVLVAASILWTGAVFPSAPLFRLSPSRAPPCSGLLPG